MSVIPDVSCLTILQMELQAEQTILVDQNPWPAPHFLKSCDSHSACNRKYSYLMRVLLPWWSRICHLSPLPSLAFLLGFISLLLLYYTSNLASLDIYKRWPCFFTRQQSNEGTVVSKVYSSEKKDQVCASVLEENYDVLCPS